MVRKKKFKANGGAMTVSTFIQMIDEQGRASLNIELIDSEGVKYFYEFCADERQGSLIQIEQRLKEDLQEAMQNFSKIEISEYAERFYLFVEIQGKPMQQYTGRRLG